MNLPNAVLFPNDFQGAKGGFASLRAGPACMLHLFCSSCRTSKESLSAEMYLCVVGQWVTAEATTEQNCQWDHGWERPGTRLI